MNKRIKVIIGGVAVAGALGAGTAVAVAGGGDDSEAPIPAGALARASAAALAHTGEGRVTDTEVGDEESYYEVEVTLNDGSEVDVQLDEDFKVVGSEADDPANEGENEGENDD